jgi:hypothetical protein
MTSDVSPLCNLLLAKGVQIVNRLYESIFCISFIRRPHKAPRRMPEEDISKIIALLRKEVFAINFPISSSVYGLSSVTVRNFALNFFSFFQFSETSFISKKWVRPRRVGSNRSRR